MGEDFEMPVYFIENEKKSGFSWRHFAAGGVAGTVSRTCTAPLDRIRIFLQVSPTKQRISVVVHNMIQEGGVTSLWRGNLVSVLKIAPETAIKFAVYDKIKSHMKTDDRCALKIHERFIAGAMAGEISQSAVYPMELLKTRLALRKTGQYSGILDAAHKIYVNEGLRSFYRGYVPNMLGVIPYAGVDLAVYETLKNTYLQNYTDQEHASNWLLVLCGGTSSTLGQACSYPFALIRTRLQAQVTNQDQDKEHTTVRGVFHTIMKREGVLGLYRGITPNFIKAFPSVSLSYVMYEYSSRLLGVNMT